MRRVLLTLILTLPLLLGGLLWFGPRLLDWEHYRGRLAELASARLGRPVTLDGPITLTLLPQPIITADRVTIGAGNDGPGDEFTVTARALRLRVDLTALLRGRLEPRELAIVGGDIRLPWPFDPSPSFRAPPWLTVLDASLEDCRLLLGSLRLESVRARLLTGAATEALAAEGEFVWRGATVRFSAQLGRAGLDGVAPLDLGLAAGGATLSARGALQPGGGFDGRLEVAGPALAPLLPVPPGAFRAAGRLTASADLLAADELTLELAGQPARGAITLRLAPETRLDIALTAGRIDLDAWLATLQGARGLALPVNIDLSAEATSLAGVPLRRLRGAAVLTGDRLVLSDVTALLPGDTQVELAGATAGAPGEQRLELGLRFAGNNLRETLLALGLPLAGTDPARLRVGEGRFKLLLERLHGSPQASMTELTATLDGSRITGNGVLRPPGEGRPRRNLGAGLEFDRLDLDGLLPARAEWPALGIVLAAVDLNLRLAADRLLFRGIPAERATLDATLENGRLALRRAALRVVGLDASLAGNATLAGPPSAGPSSAGPSSAGSPLAGPPLAGPPLASPPLAGPPLAGPPLASPPLAGPPLAGPPGSPVGPAPRFTDLALEVTGTSGAGLGTLAAVLLPNEGLGELTWDAAARAGLTDEPVALRLFGGGAPDAIQFRGEAELGALRLEGAGTLDLPGGRGGGRITLRHPGAPRLLAPLLPDGAPDWLGQGSFSLIAQLVAEPGGLASEQLDLVAGGLHATGQLGFGWAGPRPRLTGRLAFERLPLPGLPLRSSVPLRLERLAAFDAELTLSAARLAVLDAPPLENMTGHLRLAAGTLSLTDAQATLAGGALTGALRLDALAGPPMFRLEARLTDATLAEPLFGLPLDLGAGRLSAEARLTAAGHSPQALLATLAGQLSARLRDGVLVGVDLTALTAAAAAAATDIGTDTPLRRALAGGATAFESLALAATLAEGRARLDQAMLVGEAGVAASATGEIDLGRGALDVRLEARGQDLAPPIGLRLAGPAAAPRRLPELAPFLRWRAERG